MTNINNIINKRIASMCQNTDIELCRKLTCAECASISVGTTLGQNVYFDSKTGKFCFNGTNEQKLMFILAVE